MSSDKIEWAEKMLESVHDDVNRNWLEASEQLGPTPMAVMVGDARCPLIAAIAEEMGGAERVERLRSSGQLFLQFMPFEARFAFLSEYAPKGISRAFEHQERGQIMIIAVNAEGVLAQLFVEPRTMNAPGGDT